MLLDTTIQAKYTAANTAGGLTQRFPVNDSAMMSATMSSDGTTRGRNPDDSTCAAMATFWSSEVCDGSRDPISVDVQRTFRTSQIAISDPDIAQKPIAAFQQRRL